MNSLSISFKRQVIRAFQKAAYSDFLHKNEIQHVKQLGVDEKRERGIVTVVRLVGNFPGLWQRTFDQTPHRSCQWGRTLFVASGAADITVVLNSARYPIGSPYLQFDDIDLTRPVWCLHMEPEEYIRKLQYDRQDEHRIFSRCYTSAGHLISQGGIYIPSPPYVHFHIGRSYDQLMSAPRPKKRLDLAIITSDLQDLEGHRGRLKFLESLSRSGINFQLWGRGDGLRRFSQYMGPVLKKWNVLKDAKYSIVLENSISQNYWTEKYADAILAYSLPLYYGAPNLHDYFPSDSFIRLDVGDPGCIDSIREVISSDEYEIRLEAIEAARNILLQRENLYAFLDKEVSLYAR